MANGLPPPGGVSSIFDPSSFPPLPISKSTKTSEPNKPTFAESIRSKPFVHAATLPKLPQIAINPPIVATKEGLKAIIFQEEEIEESKQAFKYALVARFYGERPTVNQFDHHVNTMWGLEGTAVVGLLTPRHIMIRLENETDFIKVWSREDCLFNHVRYSLSKWTDDLQETKRALWIELQKLPVKFQLPTLLEQIGNNIGSFLALDERTRAGKHPISPRMCVEFDISKPLPQSIWIGYTLKNGDLSGCRQEITYDFTKARCSVCKQLGHEAFLCPKQAASFTLNLKKPLSLAKTKYSNLFPPKPLKKAWVPIKTRLISHASLHIPTQNLTPPSEKLDNQEFFMEHTGPKAREESLHPTTLCPANIKELGATTNNTHTTFVPLTISNNFKPILDLIPRPPPFLPHALGGLLGSSLKSPQPNSLPCEQGLATPHLASHDLHGTLAPSTALYASYDQHPNAAKDPFEAAQRKTIEEEVHKVLERAILSHETQDQPGDDQAIVPFKAPETDPIHAEPSSSIPKALNEKGLAPIAFSNAELNVSSKTVVPNDILISNSFEALADSPYLRIEDGSMQEPVSDLKLHEVLGAIVPYEKVIQAPPPKAASKKEIRNTVSWIEGDIQSVHIFENDLEDDIEESMLKHSDIDEFTRQQEVTPIKMLQDSSQKQVEIIKALTVDSTDHEAVVPSFIDSVRTAQSHIKVYSRARRAEGNSFGRIKPGMKWADVIDSEEEK